MPEPVAIPLSLYIHFPWCVRKCPYCDFNSHVVKEDLPENAYVDALVNDLEHDLQRVWGRNIISVFIGGGTPSLFSAEAIDRLLSELRARLSINANAEITLEANPGTAEQSRFTEYRDAGINRLSIGVQSFNDHQLEKLGRIHNRQEAIRAAEMAHAAGLENFNLDLMFALPGQTVKQAQQDIAIAIDLEPSHISYYQLTLEPNTLFYKQPPQLPDVDQAWQIQTAGQILLANAGFNQYEVSAYAKSNQVCKHNLNYWLFGDYLGIGAGAHGKITDAQHQAITRLAKYRHPQEYMTNAGMHQCIHSERVINRQEVGLEFMMNALRLIGGFDTELFSAHTGQPITLVEAHLKSAEASGFIEWTTGKIQPTEKGRRFLNDLLGLFIED